MKATTLTVGNTTVTYYDGPATYNSPWQNERRAELPLGRWFAARHGWNIIELGCVMPHYWDERHTVIDRFEEHPWALRADVCKIEVFTGQSVLSISTLEHVQPVAEAANTVSRIRKTAKAWFLTHPLGFSPAFDRAVISSVEPSGRFSLRRDRNDWYYSEDETDLLSLKYPFAVCIVVDPETRAALNKG